MRILNKFLSSICLLVTSAGMVWGNCTSDNPEGVDAVISCAASLHGMTAQQFWDNVLFSPVTLDGFCNSGSIANATQAQTDIYHLACQGTITHPPATPGANYFSYDNFIAADNAIYAASQQQGFSYGFMRNGSYALNVAELANFLATAAQETTGNGVLDVKYQQDGLYWRYESGWLINVCYQYPSNPKWVAGATVTQLPSAQCTQTPLANFYTPYYPVSSYAVAVNQQGEMYTKFFTYLDSRYNLAASPMTVSFPGVPDLYAGGTVPPPAGTTWTYLNDMLDPGLWIGLGNLQLTNVSMPQFFGWYEQHLASGTTTPVDYADFSAFVDNYLTNGTLAWEGGLWYWNYRVKGFNEPTLHAVLTGPKAACHDIGLTTYLVNGGCNDYAQRTQYYIYFKTNVFKQSSEGVPFTYQGESSNSMVCSANLGNYCSAP